MFAYLRNLLTTGNQVNLVRKQDFLLPSWISDTLCEEQLESEMLPKALVLCTDNAGPPYDAMKGLLGLDNQLTQLTYVRPLQLLDGMYIVVVVACCLQVV